MSEWETDERFGDKMCKEIIQELEERFPEATFRQTEIGGEADRDLSADLIVEFPDRTEVWAVKFRREDKKVFQDVTVEYMNGTGKRGDWFRFKGGIVQKYIYGFSNGETSYTIIDVVKMMKIPQLEWTTHQNKQHGSSSFKAISFKKLVRKKAIIKS